MIITILEGYSIVAVEPNRTGASIVAENAEGQRWRCLATPAHDVSALPEEVQSAIAALITPERVAAYEAEMAAIAALPELPPVPQSVTPWQARQAINAAGLRDAMEAAVAAASYEVRDAWEYALSVERHSPFVAALGSALGLTEEQIDDLFIAAAAF